MSSSLGHDDDSTAEAPTYSYEYHSDSNEDSSKEDDQRLNSNSNHSSDSNSPTRASPNHNHSQSHRRRFLRQNQNRVRKYLHPRVDPDLDDHRSSSDDDSESEGADNSSSTTTENSGGGTHSEPGILSQVGYRSGLETNSLGQPNHRKIRVTSILRHALSRMARFTSKYHKEISVLFFIIASALSVLKKGPAKIQTVSSPLPFFPPAANRFLQDNYNGDYDELSKNTIPYVPTFVFYYAPWDSESLQARNEFLNVAQYWSKTEPGLVKFVAVNCWYISGECRLRIGNRMSHFPIFVMHMSSTGVIYSGPIRSQLMIRFIHLALKPMTRLDDEDDFWNFRSQHDVLLLSYFNFTDANASNAYETYRQVALRHLEYDPFGQVGFGVILKSQLAEKYFLSASASTISLVLFNEIHTAKWNGGFQENEENMKGGKGPVVQIIEWVTERTRKLPITWLYSIRNGFANRPVALAPVDLSKEVLKGPIFLLVTRRYYPSSYSPFYNQAKEVALDYFNCNQSGNVTKLRRTLHKLNSDWMKLWKSIGDLCMNRKSTTFNCKMLLPQLEHWNSMKAYYLKDSVSNFENISSQLNFTGLSCSSQRPFRFYAIDPVDIPHFVQLAFGSQQCNFRQLENRYNSSISSSCKTQRSDKGDPMAFIIDAQNEIMMPVTSFNISELVKTIHNVTLEVESGSVKPSQLVVESPRRKKNANATNEKDKQLVLKFNSAEFLDYLNAMNSTNTVQAEPSTSSHSFSSTGESTSLFLMYTAKFCGFCNVVLAQFLSLGKFLEFYNVNITLGKIDTYANSLPSNLNPETIPSFVLYSPTSKQRNSSMTVTGIESRIFPANEEITTKTLLRFLLSELDPATRVSLSLNATSRKCSSDEPFQKADCLTTNKLSVTNQIQTVLEQLSAEAELGMIINKESMERDTESMTMTDEEVENLQAGRSITLWETELLDHLRSVKLVLDVS